MKQFKKLAAPLLAAALLMGTAACGVEAPHLPQAHLRLTPPPLLQTL